MLVHAHNAGTTQRRARSPAPVRGRGYADTTATPVERRLLLPDSPAGMVDITVGGTTYTCTEVIGKGGFGVILHATSNIGVTYAVKRVDMVASTAEAAADAEREATILGTVAHPHIVGFFGSLLESQYLSMVLELCHGPDLEQILQGMLAVGLNPDAQIVGSSNAPICCSHSDYRDP